MDSENSFGTDFWLQLQYLHRVVLETRYRYKNNSTAFSYSCREKYRPCLVWCSENFEDSLELSRVAESGVEEFLEPPGKPNFVLQMKV